MLNALKNFRWKDIEIINTVYLVGVPLAAIILAPYAYTQGALTTGILVYTLIHWFVDCYSITTVYHRCISHRSFELHPILKGILLITGAGAMQNSAVVWCSDHRRHHSFEDTPKDPYNIRKGFLWAHWGWMFFKDPPNWWATVPKDIREDKLIMWQHRHYLPLAIFVWLGVPTLIGWAMGNALGGLVFGGFVRLTLSTHCTFLINSAAHTFGKQTYSRKLTARDNWFLALFTCGEGYHNFHHKFQHDYRNGHKWYHWDPTKWGIELYAWLGLAKNLRKVPDEKLLQAKLEAQTEELATRGIKPSPVLNSIKEKLVTLQTEFRSLQSSIRELKDSGEHKGRESLDQLKSKLEEARRERDELLESWAKQVEILKRQPRVA